MKPDAPHRDRRHAVDLRLFVAGATPRSARAVARVRAWCEEHLGATYDLAVIDLYQQPELAVREQIVATPTLVRVRPQPLRRFVGDFPEGSMQACNLGLRGVADGAAG